MDQFIYHVNKYIKPNLNTLANVRSVMDDKISNMDRSELTESIETG